jgi:AAA-like domain/TIR domain
MARVFISYCHVQPDQDLADELARYLKGHRVSCFLDTRLKVGDHWPTVIEKELRACTSFVVLLSEASISSEMVLTEVKRAHDFNKRLLSIRVNYDGPVPYDLGYLNRIQWVSWRFGESFEEICIAILEGAHGGVLSRSRSFNQPSQRLDCNSTIAHAPLPQADPRIETGGLRLDSPFYVRRSLDNDVSALMSRSGETVLIKGARQVGKTSLAARVKAAAEESGQQTCYIDFQMIDQPLLRDASALLRYFAAKLGKAFRTRKQPADVWNAALGDTDNLTDFVEEEILNVASSPVVICLDEADRVFNYSYRDMFFGMLRAWHNRRAINTKWIRFNLLIAHSTEPALFIRDLNCSPFNVGTRFRLEDFDSAQISWLNTRYGSPLKGPAEIERLMRLVGGHPYLVRQALYVLSKGILASITQLENISSSDVGPFGDHLRRHVWVLRQWDALRKELLRVVDGRGCGDEGAFQRLQAGGLIVGTTRDVAKVRCELYASYFRVHL